MINQPIVRELFGLAFVGFTLIVWARAPDAPGHLYSMIMVSSGVGSGLMIIAELHQITGGVSRD